MLTLKVPAPSASVEPGSLAPAIPALPGRGSIVGLDIVRFVAALSVVLYHYAFFSWHEPASDTGVRAAIGTFVSFPALLPISWWGWVGVEIFFVISGLVICISAEHQSSSTFLRKRILRIAPALWFFATINLFVTFLYSSASIEQVLPMYLRSLVLFPKGPWIDGVYWTLTVEAVFYALTLLLIVSGWIGRLRSLALYASIAIFGFYLLVIGARLWPDLPFAGIVLAVSDAYVSRAILLTTGAYFLVGVNLHLLHSGGWSWRGFTALCASLAAGTVGIWLAAEGTAAVLIHDRSPATPVVIWLTVVGLLALALRFQRVGQTSARTQSLARTAGLASYPLYLCHNIGGAFFFGLLLAAGLGAYPALLLAMAFCVAVSVAFAIWVEPALSKPLARRLSRVAAVLRRSASPPWTYGAR